MSDRSHLDSVLVVGGGIAGLTAAHELAVRGFEVRIIESARDLAGNWLEGTEGSSFADEGPAPPAPELALGGMARTQYVPGGHAALFDTEASGIDSSPQLLPGEHGFRFFPSYYHHVWDTMQRTPLYDENGDVTARTVYDNVMPCITNSSISEASRPSIAPRRPPASIAEIIGEFEDVFRSGTKLSDVQAFSMRMLRYMCTSSKRRAAECEDISSTDYLQGCATRGAPPTIHYSEKFIEQMNFAPKVLAAFDANWGDARTNLSTTVQLSLNTSTVLPKTDGVLNGPTTSAWFKPWRFHLEELGVKFYSGVVDRFEVNDNELEIEFFGDVLDKGGVIVDPSALKASDYFVVALDAPSAENVTRELPKVGVPGDLCGYTTTVPVDIADPGKGVVRRNPYLTNGMQKWDRFQTLTGIQYFFKGAFELVHGHMNFMDTDWGLSAIFEQDFWERRPHHHPDGFGSVLSVDIGAWERPSSHLQLSASQCTKDQIKHEVWRQIVEALSHVALDRATEMQTVPRPYMFSLDTGLIFREGGPVCANRTPYLIPIIGEFPKRPGATPWNPTGQESAGSSTPLPAGVWQAGHGGYLTHWDKLVFAGVYKKTFTRLTSMEAACESGRHAVNAIIDHYLYEHSGPNVAPDSRDGLGYDWNVPVGFTTATFLSPIYHPTAIGHYCQIWNIEEHENPDLELAKKVDEWCFDHKLPHPWELLGLDSSVAVQSWLSALKSSSHHGLGEMAKLLKPQSYTKSGSGNGDGGGTSSGFGPAAATLLQVMQQLRQTLEKHAEQVSGPPDGPGTPQD